MYVCSVLYKRTSGDGPGKLTTVMCSRCICFAFLGCMCDINTDVALDACVTMGGAIIIDTLVTRHNMTKTHFYTIILCKSIVKSVSRPVY